jgi:uncharacterized protein (TIGR02145 family)
MRRLRYLFVSVCFIFLFSVSCSDDDKNTADVTDEVVLYDNVKIIDASEMTLDTDPALIAAGTYSFTFSGNQPGISAGDIIVGEQDGGFLRRVVSVSTDGNTIIFQTADADMADVFRSGSFTFSADMADMEAEGRPGEEVQMLSGGGFAYNGGVKTLYEAAGISWQINSSGVNFEPNWTFDFEFSKAGNNLKYFKMGTEGSSLSFNVNSTLSATAQLLNIEEEVGLLPTPAVRYITKYVPAVLLGVPVLVPVVVKLEADVVVMANAALQAQLNVTTDFTSSSTASLSLQYSQGTWSKTNTFTTDNQFTPQNINFNGSASASIHLGIKISTKLYGVAGPYLSIGPKVIATASTNGPLQGLADRDMMQTLGLTGITGAEASILGKNIAEYSVEYSTDPVVLYEMPQNLELVSGNDQQGSFGQPLPSPVRVRVTDSKNLKCVNIPVHFQVTQGQGLFSQQIVMTDADGYAQSSWTLGASGAQSATVTVKKADGSLIANAPIMLNATGNCAGSSLSVTAAVNGTSATATATGGQLPYTYSWSNGATGATAHNLSNGLHTVTVTDNLGCTAAANVTVNTLAVTDIDGNQYSIVVIGNQTWMKENLNVSHYRNGDVIPQVQDALTWQSLTSGAWCYYENNTANGTVYGKLYNWYAVTDPRGLAPEGWHIPNHSEWSTLGNYLGGNSVAGGKMKATSGWDVPNTGATNESGFTGLGSGYRKYSDGLFHDIGKFGFWWSSTIDGVAMAWERHLHYELVDLMPNFAYKDNGFSVRCVKD